MLHFIAVKHVKTWFNTGFVHFGGLIWLIQYTLNQRFNSGVFNRAIFDIYITRLGYWGSKDIFEPVILFLLSLNV